MRRIKLYLDTSVISHIEAPHKPVEEKMTRQFFQTVAEKSDEFEILLSPVVITELEDSPPDFRMKFSDFLESLEYYLIPYNMEAVDLATSYCQQGVLAERHIRDLTHIAYAVVTRCDYIVSWNMKHFVNVHTIRRVNTVNEMNNYHAIFIVTPQHIIGDQINADD
ncbi:MAG: hypothetical protein ACRC10_10690 [Thermoguttaceae bacterium]